MPRLSALVVAASLVASAGALAEGKKYELKVEPAKAKAGAPAKAGFKIAVAPGSHVSDEAPLRISLKSEGLKLAKEKLTTADVVDGKGSSPRFEIPFTAEKKGAQSITADAVFIVCTKELCERETEKVTIPVTVE
jgi:hypothetical protein